MPKMPRVSKAALAKVVTAAVKRKAPAKHKLAEEFPSGEILFDVAKGQWKLGPVIGKGGFGLIYLATDDLRAPVDKHAQYVVKIEPIDNGPLFCELHFYQRAAKIEMIDSWVQERRLRYLGVPKYIGTGRHEKNGRTYRFMVIQRFSTDLQKLFVKSQTFLPRTVMALGLRMIDALEYLHENEYIHADIKAANMLLGYKGAKIAQDEVYLVDYGLAFRYSVDGKHKEYKEDPRKAHDGTIEFTSRDAHKGVCPSRRGDFEILGYCMLQWLCGRLPWEDNLSDPDYVRDSKIKYMRNIPSLLKACFPGRDHPDAISSYLSLVVKLDYDEKPDYKQLRKILLDGLHKMGCKDEWKLHLPPSGTISTTPIITKVQRKRKSPLPQDDSGEPSFVPPKQRKTTSKVVRSPVPAVMTSPRRRKVASPGKTKPPKTLSNGQIDLSSVSWAARSPSADVKKTKSATGPKRTHKHE
ncbi:serine/threonine-protein kinase VRK1-like isoform X2 [Gigantopelta aegis]|uniref:serine/threonine-protein kinase VRK1-like isoform X2 n=1 Tax=Gigantopelta aegis TaxID=1735272 RepID=UPI001B8899AF|nr:serine/threonine-protein kinase VRK1-like isoform X2 [Gigantopelta aegis]